MPQICKQALEGPICMLLGEELGNSTVPVGSPLLYDLAMYCGAQWTEADPQRPLVARASSVLLCRHRNVLDLKEWSLSRSGRSMCPSVCRQCFAPAHFWPSLKHLFSRCCSWQASHDIESEILTENQTASRPLAAPSRWLVFAVQICTFCLPFLGLELTLTWNKLLYHNPLCFFASLFLPLTPGSWQLCPVIHCSLKSLYHPAAFSVS